MRPPTRSPASNTTTSISRSAYAAESPAIPPPTTTTSCTEPLRRDLLQVALRLVRIHEPLEVVARIVEPVDEAIRDRLMLVPRTEQLEHVRRRRAEHRVRPRRHVLGVVPVALERLLHPRAVERALRLRADRREVRRRRVAGVVRALAG